MYVVILAGGSGSRFWPLSRVEKPKQLISLTGEKSMLQRTVERALSLKPKRILIVTSHMQAAESKRQTAQYHSVPIEVIPEPASRNTAPAVAVAAAIISAHDPSAVMVLLPADHYIRDEAAFGEALLKGVQAARKGYLVTLGVIPVRPETGYGYIEADTDLRGDGPFPVSSFIEKPPLEKALLFLENENYFWNSGIFSWRADIVLSEIRKHAPELYDAVSAIDFKNDVWDMSDLQDIMADAYCSMESRSIDYAVLEKSDKIQVVPVEMGWSDVGSWGALPEIFEPDENGTVCINSESHVTIESSDNIIYMDGRMVATVGVKGLILVSTPDALLVCDRRRSQDVKRVVEQLAAGKESRYL